MIHVVYGSTLARHLRECFITIFVSYRVIIYACLVFGGLRVVTALLLFFYLIYLLRLRAHISMSMSGGLRWRLTSLIKADYCFFSVQTTVDRLMLSSLRLASNIDNAYGRHILEVYEGENMSFCNLHIVCILFLCLHNVFVCL